MRSSRRLDSRQSAAWRASSRRGPIIASAHSAKSVGHVEGGNSAIWLVRFGRSIVHASTERDAARGPGAARLVERPAGCTSSRRCGSGQVRRDGKLRSFSGDLLCGVELDGQLYLRRSGLRRGATRVRGMQWHTDLLLRMWTRVRRRRQAIPPRLGVLLHGRPVYAHCSAPEPGRPLRRRRVGLPGRGVLRADHAALSEHDV